MSTIPETSDHLQSMAAKLALDIPLEKGLSDADVLWTTIDALMNEGFYDDTCLTALDSKPPRINEVMPAFLAALHHFGGSYPNRERAVWILQEHCAQRIVRQEIDPHQGLWEIINVRRERGHGYDTGMFESIFWSIDDRSHSGQLSDEEWLEVHSEIVAEAGRWLRELPTNTAYLQCLRHQDESTS